MALTLYSNKIDRYNERSLTNTTSTTYAIGDALTLTSGKLVAVSAGTQLIAGVAESAVTSAVAGTKGQVLVPDADTIFSIAPSSGSPDATKIGQFANITGSSGAMKLDTTTIATAPTSANTGTGVITALQLAIVGVDPDTTANYLVSIHARQLTR